ncbi:hypothetical protein KSP40_PGU019613 [Platanthera guangdongensis]|uniref:RNase H type-1 domain-containing protein n=1 Tax=Platanthera guangdongensis TaxID=2320717 RepID=A0ABR2LS86_9ASPA
MLQGLESKLASQMAADYMGIILEGDSCDACKSLNQILSGCCFGDVDSDLAHLLPSFRRVEISLVNRKANSVADHVAKNACFNEFSWDRGMPLTTTFALLLSHDANFM